MMGIIEGVTERVFGEEDDGLDLENLTLEDLNHEKADIRADVKLKRDRHSDLSDKRENLFEEVVQADDELLKKEMAEEIVSIEDEMAILHNEHAQLMDALRVIDGLIAIKRKEKMAQREGLISQIQDMNREDLVDKLRRADVREMIRDEKWDQLNSLLSGQLTPEDIDNERVTEIIQHADDVKDLEEEMGTQEAVEHALEERDARRVEKVDE
ncbi:MAG: hypothetical protein MUP63_00955 [Candidatus Nanohaloarchaeota archaeon QJJ-7]|nr:hypothetical protein [Candidatus Nanohaloarchaeota archaeon QJJ-7]